MKEVEERKGWKRESERRYVESARVKGKIIESDRKCREDEEGRREETERSKEMRRKIREMAPGVRKMIGSST